MLSLSLSLPLEAPKTTFGLITSTGNKDQRRLDNFAEASDICVKVADKTSQDIVNTCLSPGSLLSVATANIEPLEGDKLLFNQELVFKGDVTVDSSFIIELRACVLVFARLLRVTVLLKLYKPIRFKVDVRSSRMKGLDY